MYVYTSMLHLYAKALPELGIEAFENPCPSLWRVLLSLVNTESLSTVDGPHPAGYPAHGTGALRPGFAQGCLLSPGPGRPNRSQVLTTLSSAL